MIIANQVKVGTLVQVRKYVFRVARIIRHNGKIIFFDKFEMETEVNPTDKITVLD